MSAARASTTSLLVSAARRRRATFLWRRGLTPPAFERCLTEKSVLRLKDPTNLRGQKTAVPQPSSTDLSETWCAVTYNCLPKGSPRLLFLCLISAKMAFYDENDDIDQSSQLYFKIMRKLS